MNPPSGPQANTDTHMNVDDQLAKRRNESTSNCAKKTRPTSTILPNLPIPQTCYVSKPREPYPNSKREKYPRMH